MKCLSIFYISFLHGLFAADNQIHFQKNIADLAGDIAFLEGLREQCIECLKDSCDLSDRQFYTQQNLSYRDQIEALRVQMYEALRKAERK